jgi:hypothetical protein
MATFDLSIPLNKIDASSAYCWTPVVILSLNFEFLSHFLLLKLFTRNEAVPMLTFNSTDWWPLDSLYTFPSVNIFWNCVTVAWVSHSMQGVLTKYSYSRDITVDYTCGIHSTHPSSLIAEDLLPFLPYNKIHS